MQKLLVAVLALLVSHAAGGLASGLAGSLALAAAAGLNALGQVTSSNSLDTLHDRNLSNSQKFIAPGINPGTLLSCNRISRSAPFVKIFSLTVLEISFAA